MTTTQLATTQLATTQCCNRTGLQRFAVLTYAGRALILLCALTLGSCSFLIDEFAWLDHAGSVAGPQQLAPTATSDRP